MGDAGGKQPFQENTIGRDSAVDRDLTWPPDKRRPRETPEQQDIDRADEDAHIHAVDMMKPDRWEPHGQELGQKQSNSVEDRRREHLTNPTGSDPQWWLREWPTYYREEGPGSSFGWFPAPWPTLPDDVAHGGPILAGPRRPAQMPEFAPYRRKE